MNRWQYIVTLVLAFAVAGCAPGGPGGRSEGPSEQPTAAPKVLTLAQINPVATYGPWDFSNTTGGSASLVEVHSVGLVTEGHNGVLEPRLAAAVPSFDDGTMVILPDGRMRATWKLRPNVTWQDGTPFTADDLVFSWQISTHPDLRPASSESLRQTDSVEAPDPHTFVVLWKSTFYLSLRLTHRDLWPMPRHLLADGFVGDRETFLGLPYFTTDYIHLGPYRLVDWGLGENQVFERYDRYFMGQPKVDRIIIRSIADPVAILVNLKAGAVDIAAEKTLLSDVYVDLREEWRQSGEGTLLERQENWRYIWFQFHPEYARPLELSQDVRLRRGLAYAFDRHALQELILPGFATASGDSFMEAIDPRAPAVGKPFERYRLDPARAAQEFADGGWRRTSDGRLLNASGQQVQIEIRGNSPDVKELALIADNWRRLGIDVSEYIPPPALARDNEFKSKFPGLETRARGVGDGIFTSFDGRLGSGPQNRWLASNTSHYANANLDRSIDRLYTTLDASGQGRLLAEMGDLMASDLPAISMYFRVAFTTIRKNVRGPIFEDYPATRGSGGGIARNAHLWDRA